MFTAATGGRAAKVVDRGLRRSCYPRRFVRPRPIRRPFAASRVVAVGVAACMAVVVLPGCASQWTAAPDEQAGQPTAGSAAVHEHGSRVPAVKAVDASDLRAQVEQLLGQHAILTVRLTRARLRGDGDLAQSADEALSKNTADLGELIGTVYGAEAAEKFEQMWFGHVTYLFNYARGVADKDEAVKSQARRQLDDYTTDLSEFLETATKKAAPASVVAAGLRMHVDQLMQQVDAYGRGDYERAFALERESYAHMFPLSKTLAAAILTGGGAALPVDFDSPARQLQSRLGMLLGEHAELAVDAMRSGISNSADFPAAGAALDGNTREITAMIESVFGATSAGSFQALWADHIDAFVTYTQALVADDAALEKTATERLKEFNVHFAAFLSTSTQGRLGTPALADAFVMHEDLLLRQINAYAERDYSTAHQLSFDAYEHMFALAAQAATAIGDTVTAQSPTGGPQTGGGGMAPARGAP
jgi:TolA-binding protein